MQKVEFRFRRRDVPGLVIKLRSFFSALEDKQYIITVDEYREKRSRDANAYFWVLCGKVAEKSGVPKSDVYRSYIKDVGGNYEVLPIKDIAVSKFCKAWGSNGMGFVAETVPSKLEGYTNVIAYYGSHLYDSAQMSRLIDLCIQDCKALDIDTMTPMEIASLIDRWGK